MKSIYKIIFFTFLIVGTICYEAKAAIVYASDYSTKTDTVTGIVSKLTKTAIKWSSDNITRTTTYTYADKTTYVVVATVQPTTSSSVSGIIKTTVSTYGNGKVVTTKETATLVTGSVTYNLDYSTKSSTYRFLDSSTIIVTSLLSKTAVKWATDNVTRTSTYTYADRTTYVVTVTVPPTVNVSWAADHITKTTLTTYGNGKTSSAVTIVPGTIGTPTYNNNIKTVITTYGDGTSSTATFTASGSSVSWATDHITKTTTYTYASGGSNNVVTTHNPTISTPALTNAVYPGDWTTTGTVTPPNVSSKTTTYGDGYTSVAEDGTSSKPFLQTTLSGLSISDPSKYVTSNTTTYDLRWGTPDKNGPAYASLFPSQNSSITFNNSFIMYGQTVSGQGCFAVCGPTIRAPHPEVIDAWNQGWTGKNISILMEDWLTQAHGVTTTLIANRYAPGSTIYGFNMPTGLGIYNQSGTVASPTSMINIGVINASHGANLSYLIGHNGPWSDSELSNAANAFASNSSTFINRYTGVTTFNNFNLTDSVITKAAGNDGLSGLTADKEPLVKALASNSDINSRLLIVGALNLAGSIGAQATISNYSNKAGSDLSVQSRFVVASGTTPFQTGDIALNGVPISATISVDPNGVQLGNVGTSYAAPRVAGYVAIVRSKFPNLNAANTSSIMLDTARYDTLSCNPNCNPEIYGKGEVSLSRALAPVGRLR